MLKLKGSLVNTVHTTAANIGSASAVYIFADNAATITIAGSGSPFCLLYTSPSPRDRQKSRMPSSA